MLLSVLYKRFAIVLEKTIDNIQWCLNDFDNYRNRFSISTSSHTIEGYFRKHGKVPGDASYPAFHNNTRWGSRVARKTKSTHPGKPLTPGTKYMTKYWQNLSTYFPKQCLHWGVLVVLVKRWLWFLCGSGRSCNAAISHTSWSDPQKHNVKSTF